MSRDSDPSIPPALRDRLQDEGAEERADLEAVWHLLGDTDPVPDEALDLDDEWAALQERRPEAAPDADTDAVSPNGQAPPAAPSADASRSRTPRRPSRADRPRRSGRSRRWGRWVGALTVAVLMVVGAAWIWRQPVTLTAPPGQQRTVTLPDGSTADLNSGTTLSYRRSFQAWPFVEADRRRVRLDGEAFFTVQDADRPFVVATATARVRVTGTQFNVRARTAIDSATAVTVASGRVEVQSRRRTDQSVVLDGPGQTSRVQGGQAAPTPPRSTRLDPVLAWRQNGFAVTETPLAAVAQELERRYDTSIRLHASVTRTNAPLTLYYPKPASLPTILRDLCTALDLNYRPTSRGYEIFAGPNRR